MRPKRLGRGLGNLIHRTEEDPMPPALVERGKTPPPEASGPAASPQALPVDRIRPNPFQPRATFHPDALQELTDSIRTHGVLQPVVVRRGPVGFELIAGERRLRAAHAAGLEAIPAIVRDATDEEMQTLALVENLQREDLNAMEKARALRAMMRNFGITQDEAATRVGKARTTIANVLRLLDLPGEIQTMVEEGRLSGAHARAILQAQGIERRLEIARLAEKRGLSVREVERLARAGPTIGKRRKATPDPYLKDLEDRLRRALTADVRVEARGKGGRIEIPYADADELDRLLAILTKDEH